MKNYTVFILILSILFFSSCNRKRDKPTFTGEYKIYNTTELELDSYFIEKKKKSHTPNKNTKAEELSILNSKVIAQKGEKVRPLYRVGKYDLLVEKQNGERGVIKYWALEEFRTFAFDEVLKLSVKNKDNRWEALEVPPNTTGKIIETIQKNGYSHHVKMENGMEGNFGAYKIAITIPTEIKSLYYDQEFYTEKRFKRMVMGLTIEELEAKLLPLDYIFYSDDKNRNGFGYYDDITVYSGATSHEGIQVNISEGKVSGLTYSGKSESKWYAYLPFKGILMRLPFKTFNNNITSDYWHSLLPEVDDSYSGSRGFIDENLPFLIYWIFLILAPISALLIGYKMARNNAISNEILILTTSGLMLLFTYIIWLPSSLNSQEAVFIMFLIQFGIAFFLINNFNKRIKYHRCPVCNTYEKTKDIGSSFKGTEQESSTRQIKTHTKTTTEETEDKIIETKHYNVHDETTVTTYAKYDDHRECQNCGYKWDIGRKEKVGEETF